MALATLPGVPVVLTTTGKIVQGDGRLKGFFVSSSTALTLKIWDNFSAASGNVLLDTTTALAVGWYNLPVSFGTGAYATIGGTGSVTFVWERA